MPKPTKEQAIEALCAESSYPTDSGWLRSYQERVPVDAEGNPLPWYTYAAADFIGRRLTKDMKVFEWGAGYSTLWYAKRVREVVSIDHSEGWVKKLCDHPLPKNVNLFLKKEEVYAKSILDCAPDFHVICIDGMDRIECAKLAWNGLTSHGVVVWDNANDNRHIEGYEFLKSKGFRRIDFFGWLPVCTVPGCTSVFYRDYNCFGI